MVLESQSGLRKILCDNPLLTVETPRLEMSL